MTTAHTPTPWKWVEGDPYIFTMWSQKRVTLATVKHPEWHEDSACGSREAGANAAHIVKCVNMHDELVEALKKCGMLLEHGGFDLEFIDKALKKAGAL